MSTRWILRAVAVIGIALGGAACGGPVEFAEELSLSEAMIEEESALSEVHQAKVAPPPQNCHPDLPPCACELAGTYACSDPDGDRRVNMEDNCDNTYNPTQANCDSDSYGDACDSLSGTQTKSKYLTHKSSYYSGYEQCYMNQRYLQTYLVYDEYERVTTTYCAGPNAGQTTTTTSYLRTFTTFCFQYSGYCAINNTSYMPQPWCG